MTASLWMRGILGDHYGVDLGSVDWFTGGLDEPGRQEKSKVAPPPRYRVQHIGAERTLSARTRRSATSFQTPRVVKASCA